ncbi:hypothetical protein THIOM_000532 [Candidatus Thiomargarita nelsonii]|uniref:Uncharacterized protein n=1 Tax=Candidatus Thiomargarita nelsonii TaxID=1003181 RepID=A0A176S702_9GAMM|nr:hypothetical protein THIOM_000532 [Candidatus Thiomargarita nelsonii]
MFRIILRIKSHSRCGCTKIDSHNTGIILTTAYLQLGRQLQLRTIQILLYQHLLYITLITFCSNRLLLFIH